jgi:triosephosphate isomerase
LFHFIINSKNYENAAGVSALKLAAAVSEVETRRNKVVRFYLAVPAFSVSLLADKFPALQILTQHLDYSPPGSTTGFLVPKIAKLSGASGSLVNHSEHRISLSEIEHLVQTLRDLEMKSFVCAQDEKEVKTLAGLSPDFIAIEPPELIGSGNAVSKARPSLITDSLEALEEGSSGRQPPILLCGAGIVDAEDVKTAAKLGASGVLVASGVIRANDWKSKILSITSPFSDEAKG